MATPANWKSHLLQLEDGYYYFNGDPQAVRQEAMDSFRRLMTVDRHVCAECVGFRKWVLFVLSDVVGCLSGKCKEKPKTYIYI